MLPSLWCIRYKVKVIDLENKREVDRNKMKDLQEENTALNPSQKDSLSASQSLQASGVVQSLKPQELYFSMVEILFLHV